jgi:TetR/AcrR family transcriptional repressor of mexJK operon
MVTPKTGRPVGRPLDTEKAEAIVAAGWTLFLAHGVEGVALETIAAKANVSKATLYKHFPGKAALFQAGVEREMRMIEAAQGLAPGDQTNATLEDRLRQFGLGIMIFLLSDSAVDFYSALSGELRRHPDLARRFFDKGPGRTRANLSRIIAEAIASGELIAEDPDEAAEQLFGLWQGMSNFHLSLGVESADIRNSLSRRIDRGLSVFLKAYGYRPMQ